VSSTDHETLRLRPANAAIRIDTRLDHAVVVLPSQLNGDVGIYSGQTTGLVKQLRTAGVDAAFLHDSQHKQWDVRMGDVPTELVIAFVGGLLSAATWAAVQTVLQNFVGSRSEVHARVVSQRQEPDGSVQNTWFAYRGDKDGFLTALSAMDLSGKSSDE
jgi:hypothetical protein